MSVSVSPIIPLHNSSAVSQLVVFRDVGEVLDDAWEADAKRVEVVADDALPGHRLQFLYSFRGVGEV